MAAFAVTQSLGAPMWLAAYGLGMFQFKKWSRTSQPLIKVRVEQRVVRMARRSLKLATLSPSPYGDGVLLTIALQLWKRAPLSARIFGLPFIADVEASKALTGVDFAQNQFHGAAALRVLANIMPIINSAGANAVSVAQAVSVLERFNGPAEMLAALSEGDKHESNRRFPSLIKSSGVVAGLLPASVRLAMEMSLHEDDERRAPNGELAELETRWKDAEEIAAISDSLLLPTTVSDRVDELREQNREQ